MNANRPLIFVPGIRTSTLAIKNENRNGGQLEHFWPLMPHEFLVREKLDRVFQYLETKIRTKADDDDEVQVVATGLIPFAYDGLIKSILSWGYMPGVNFWIFPYDWRQSNNVSGQLLARFIEQKIDGGGDKCRDGVDIISHSMGGIITRAAYKYGAPIRRSAYIACPHFGSPLAYFILHPEIDSRRFMGSVYPDPYMMHTNTKFYWQSSDTDDIDPRRRTTTLYQRRKELFVKFPSIYELLPDESYLDSRPLLFVDGKPIWGVDDTYLKNDWAFKTQDMQSNVRKAMQFKRDLGLEIPGNKEHDDVLLICGTDKMTCDTIEYKMHYQASITTLQKRRNGTTYVMQRGFSLPYDSGRQHQGDGYVPITSAMASLNGIPTYANTVGIPEIPHAILPNEKTTTESIRGFLIS
jgi:hypothetical protein